MIRSLFALNITKYFGISCIAGIIDFLVAYLLFKIGGVNYLVACNIGIVLGFIFQYFICRIYIFKQRTFFSFFFIYIATFLFGLVLADATMWICFNKLRLPFIISKAMSMALPFFVLYLTRKSLLGLKISKGKPQ